MILGVGTIGLCGFWICALRLRAWSLGPGLQIRFSKIQMYCWAIGLGGPRPVIAFEGFIDRRNRLHMGVIHPS